VQFQTGLVSSFRATHHKYQRYQMVGRLAHPAQADEHEDNDERGQTSGNGRMKRRRERMWFVRENDDEHHHVVGELLGDSPPENRDYGLGEVYWKRFMYS
jgi:hypothetical protein